MKKQKEISIIDNEGNIVKGQQNFKKKKVSTLDQVGKYGNYLNLGFYLVIPLLAGVFGGFYLDKWLNTKPFFILLFIFLGSIATFYNLIKLTKEKDDSSH